MNDNKTNVEILGGMTCLDIPVSRVLHAAMSEGLTDIVICGTTKDGEPYYASNIADPAQSLWKLEKMKQMLLNLEGE